MNKELKPVNEDSMLRPGPGHSKGAVSALF